MHTELAWVPGLFWQSALAIVIGTIVLGLLLRAEKQGRVIGWFVLWFLGIVPLIAINWWTNSGGPVSGPPEAYPMDQELPHYLTLGVIVAVMALILTAVIIKVRRSAPRHPGLGA